MLEHKRFHARVNQFVMKYMNCFKIFMILLCRFGMFYQTKKLWRLWHLHRGLLLLDYWLSQLFFLGRQNSLSVRLMIVLRCASSLIQIQSWMLNIPQTSWHQMHQRTQLLINHLYLVRMELEWKPKNCCDSIAFVPYLFPSLFLFRSLGKLCYSSQRETFFW